MSMTTGTSSSTVILSSAAVGEADTQSNFSVSAASTRRCAVPLVRLILIYLIPADGMTNVAMSASSFMLVFALPRAVNDVPFVLASNEAVTDEDALSLAKKTATLS